MSLRARAEASRGMSGLGDFIDVVTFKPVRDLASDVVDVIPGLSDLVNGPLRDFARTAVGHAVLIAISGAFYGTTGSGLVPWVGPQLASVAFAVPGLMAGDDFLNAWLQGVKERTERTMQIAGIDAAQIFSQQLTDTLTKMADDFGVSNLVEESIAELVDRYGIRQDVATFAKSLWNKIEIPQPCTDEGCSGDMFDPLTGAVRSGITRLQGAGISLATLMRSDVVGSWSGDNTRASLSTLARAANYSGFQDYRSIPKPTGYGVANTSPNRASGDVLLGVSLVAAGAALWFFFRR